MPICPLQSIWEKYIPAKLVVVTLIALVFVFQGPAAKASEDTLKFRQGKTQLLCQALHFVYTADSALLQTLECRSVEALGNSLPAAHAGTKNFFGRFASQKAAPQYSLQANLNTLAQSPNPLPDSPAPVPLAANAGLALWQSWVFWVTVAALLLLSLASLRQSLRNKKFLAGLHEEQNFLREKIMEMQRSGNGEPGSEELEQILKEINRLKGDLEGLSQELQTAAGSNSPAHIAAELVEQEPGLLETLLKNSPVKYARSPVNNGFYRSSMQSYPGEDSVFIIHLDPEDPDKATYYVNEAERMQPFIIQNLYELLDPATTVVEKAEEPEQVTNLEGEPGELERNGDFWRITRRARINLVGKQKSA